jgi:hypothetical protein
MKWFWQRSSGLEERDDGEVRNQAEVQPSLALNTLFRQLRKDRRYHILELGPAIGQNVDFLAQFSCRIRVEDLYHTLVSFDYLSSGDNPDYEAVFQYLLPYDRTTRFDIVLAWDVLNYLERHEFEYLMKHLSRFCHNGSVLFALIATVKHMPDRPGLFTILDENNLRYENRCTVFRPCPRYHDADLKKLMPTFRIYNSYLLRNGMKEYLFVAS